MHGSPFLSLPIFSPHKGPVHCSSPPFPFSSKVGQGYKIPTSPLQKKVKDRSGLIEKVRLQGSESTSFSVEFPDEDNMDRGEVNV